MIAELLYKSGWKIELMPLHADNGIDIIAVSNFGDVHHKMIVQVKKYHKQHKVGVDVVRELMYIVDKAKVNSGLIATTSYFTKGAIEERNLNYWRLNLKDFNKITDWLQTVTYNSR